MKKYPFIALRALLAATVLVVADDSSAPDAVAPKRAPLRINPPQSPLPKVNPNKPMPGDPLPSLSTNQLSLFRDGKDDFENEEDVESGLGPIFNEASCVACHHTGATGGGSARNVTRFGRTTNGVFDPLESLGGSLLQDHAILPGAAETIPPEANTIIQRNSPPLFGMGLIDAIPEDAILKNVHKHPVDGVTGRPAYVIDVVSGQLKVGRFGWKCEQATLLAMAADAYRNELGITNRYFPTENAPNGNVALLAKYDFVADPEDAPATGLADFEKVANFMKYLAPAPGKPLTPSAIAGAQLFQMAGCAVCHVPTMMTGPNSEAAFNRREVRLYSDLLLHNMGALADGVSQGDATEVEMRTPPLWGLQYSAPYLHDGRATTVDDAILAHDGEGKVARDRYSRFTPTQRKQLADFLLSL
jgi:CxxC motif-containing protein (DUF1111 family)